MYRELAQTLKRAPGLDLFFVRVPDPTRECCSFLLTSGFVKDRVLRPRVCANLGCNGSKVMKIAIQMADCPSTSLFDMLLYYYSVVWVRVIVLSLPPSISARQCDEPGLFYVLKSKDVFRKARVSA